MAHVVEYEEFREVLERLRIVEADNHFLKSMILNQSWLNRAQAMSAIGVSEKTLKRLTDEKLILSRYEGTKPFYCIHSVRAYLLRKNNEETDVTQRLLKACISTKGPSEADEKPKDKGLKKSNRRDNPRPYTSLQ